MDVKKDDSLCNIDKYDAHNIGKRIKGLSYARNITIKELCVAARVSANVVQQMASLGKMPRVDTLARLADVLDISIDTLLDRTATATAEPLNLDEAIKTVAAAAGVTPAALKAVLHL